MSFRRRMILSMLLAVVLCGAISAAMGGYLLWRHLTHEAEIRVRQELNAARAFYNQRLEAMAAALSFTALGERFSSAVAERDIAYVKTRLDAVRAKAGLHLLCVTDSSGEVIHRAHRPELAGDSLSRDPLVRRVLAGEDVVFGTLLVDAGVLEKEDPSLARLARMPILDTPKADASSRTSMDAGMMLCAAAAVRGRDGELVGLLLSGVLLNQNFELVDQVQNTVFRNELYRGRLLGTATVFQDDVRISTNVLRQDGSRATGTRVSAEVYDRVLRQGKTWLGLAWVVNDWYISAYEPIRDINNERIGMLYIGILQRKFRDLMLRTLAFFALVPLVGLVVASFVGWQLAKRISRPISNLSKASSAIALGEFSQVLPVESSDEIGALTGAFNTMARSLMERDKLLKERTRLQLTRSERLASIGRLAAGVAHEINNPLTGVLTFAHMLLKNAPQGSQDREDVQTIIDATTRCKQIVRGLLDFSRQNAPNKSPADLNDLLADALNLTQNQAKMGRVKIVQEFDRALPSVVIDADQILEVAVNIIVNALDAMPDGGELTVRTSVCDEDDRGWVKFEISDTGHGIPRDNLEHIFDPFFTTKPTGKGTGLGLAVAYGIITEHEGRMNITSEVGTGSTFVVLLPVGSEN